MLICTLVALPPVSGTPLEQMFEFYQTTQHLSVKFESQIDGQDFKNTGTYSWVMPDQQQVVVNFPVGSMEFRQSATLTHFIDHESKTYREYPTFQPLTFRPEGAASIFFPFAFFRIKLDSKRAETPKKTTEMVVDGIQATEFQFGEPGQKPGTSTMDIVVDRFGRMIRVSFDRDENGNIVRYIHSFSNYNVRAESIKIRKEIESGYVPEAAISQHFPPMPGSGLPPVKVAGTNGGTVELNRLLNGKISIVLVTDPECQPSAKGKAIWKKLDEMVKSYKGQMVEISLTKTNVKGFSPGRLMGDKFGEFEKFVQPPVTPYLFLIDKEGTIFQGWAGYHADQDQRILKVFKAGLEAIK